MRPGPAFLFLVLVGFHPAAGSEIAGSRWTVDPAAVLAEIRSAELDTSRPRDAADLRLQTGFATVDLRHGILIPVRTASGEVVEWVFAGYGELILDPPDDIEAGQLELFTGEASLRESFTEAVFVVARDAAAAALAARPAAVPEPVLAARAEAFWEAWQTSPERRTLGVEIGVLLDALEVPIYEEFFAGWFSGGRLGRFFLQMDPAEVEQINLGQFVRFDPTAAQHRRISGFLHRQQQQGRLVGLEVEDLGRWDTWVSSSLRSSGGLPRPGAAAFEPRHYSLEVTVDPPSGRLVSRSRIELDTLGGHRRAVRLKLSTALEVTRLRNGAGEELFFLRQDDELYVVLPRAPSPGARVVLEVDAEGVFLEPGGNRNWALRESVGWYPRTGSTERATYDVTLRWPREFDLVASGREVEGGRGQGMRWQRRRLDVPALGFSFSVGHFKTRTAKAGKVEITVALDPSVVEAMGQDSIDELTATVVRSFTYFRKVFGDYPLDQLTVVTVPRQFSQAMLGYISLSSPMMVNWGLFGSLLGVQDRRAVVAHEVAHQWWGHLVGWRGYRDQWISEAMANYAALAWSRHRGLKTAVGPVTGWQEELTTTLADGRSLESMGPLVLGERLFSSRSRDAYHAIVYRKGALVLSMLARRLGEDVFLAAMRQLIAAARGQVISTEEFLALLERITAEDLDGFARQFIYGTGLPEIYYDYAFEKTAKGRWSVRVSALQEAPHRTRFAIVPAADGRPTIERHRIEQLDVDSSELVVPFQILVPRDPSMTGRFGGQPSRQPVLDGRMLISGRHTEHRFEIDQVPLKMWFDARQEVLGRFFDQRLHPKRMLLNQGLDKAAGGELGEAEEIFRRALRAKSPMASTDGLLDAHIYLQLATVELDADEDERAAASLASAREVFAAAGESLPGSEARRFKNACEIVEARLEIERGDYEGARLRLRRGVLDERDATSTEGFLLLAIAARETGRELEVEEALEVARERGADVSWFSGGGSG
ncbi:MAG: M1 family aminopeptidase [Thermoanaerobaculia bacterium]